MKNLTFSVLAAALLSVSAITVKAQTVDEIINKHVTAIGGADNWKKINSVKMTGSVNAGGTELPITTIVVKNKGFRMDLVFNGMSNYQIITTKDGWMYFPIQGQIKPEAVPAEMVKESQDELDIEGPLVDYKNKANKIVYLGKDDVEGTECYKLKVTYANGKEETMYIDVATNYHIRSVEKTKANGKEVEETTNYSNYQKLPEGIVMPMAIESGNGPFAVKSIEINKPVDESIFVPAEVAAGKK